MRVIGKSWSDEMDLQPLISGISGEDPGDRPVPWAGRQFQLLIKESREQAKRQNRPLEQVFQRNWRGLLGLRDLEKPDRRGFQTVFEKDKARVTYEDLPMREVASSIFSAQFVDGLGNPKISSANVRQLRESASPMGDWGRMPLREAFAPVTASTQQDINLWSIYVGGLFEAKFLEGYQSPEFIGRGLVFREPTNARQQRIITTANVPAPSKAVGEGQEYPNAGVLPRWIIRPELFKRGQKCSVTKEAIAYGVGGTLLKSLERGGYALGYIEEYAIAAYIQGIAIPAGNIWFADGLTVNTYIYNQEPNATQQPAYQTMAGSGATAMYNYVNKYTGVGALVNFLQLQTARNNFSMTTEYETGFRINTKLEDMKVGIANLDTTYNVLKSTSIVPVTPAGFATSGTPVMTFSNGIPGNQSIKVYSSPIWDQQMLDASVSAADVLARWYIGQFAQAFGWAYLWDTVMNVVDPRSGDMVGSDIVWAATFGWCGTPYIREPRFAQYNTE